MDRLLLIRTWVGMIRGGGMGRGGNEDGEGEGEGCNERFVY